MRRTILARVEADLAFRWALGYKLHIEGQMLHSFARYADRSGHHEPLTRDAYESQTCEAGEIGKTEVCHRGRLPCAMLR